MGRWMNEVMSGWVDAEMNIWMNGWLHGWMHRWEGLGWAEIAVPVSAQSGTSKKMGRFGHQSTILHRGTLLFKC